jgi:hypothetical protein
VRATSAVATIGPTIGHTPRITTATIASGTSTCSAPTTHRAPSAGHTTNANSQGFRLTTPLVTVGEDVGLRGRRLWGWRSPADEPSVVAPPGPLLEGHGAGQQEVDRGVLDRENPRVGNGELYWSARRALNANPEPHGASTIVPPSGTSPMAAMLL